MSTLPMQNAPPTVRNESAETVHLVSFRLGGEEYAIAIAKVQEIILPSPITQLPQAPSYIRGLINLRNAVIPVVDLRLRFGLPAAKETDATRIIVVNVCGKRIGLVVDAVTEVLRVHCDQVASPPSAVAGAGREYITGLANLEGRLLILLDLDRIFTADAPCHPA